MALLKVIAIVAQAWQNYDGLPRSARAVGVEVSTPFASAQQVEQQWPVGFQARPAKSLNAGFHGL